MIFLSRIFSNQDNNFIKYLRSTFNNINMTNGNWIKTSWIYCNFHIYAFLLRILISDLPYLSSLILYIEKSFVSSLVSDSIIKQVCISATLSFIMFSK